jgi:hypothetical protein
MLKSSHPLTSKPRLKQYSQYSRKIHGKSPLCDMRSRRPNHRANEHQSRAISSVRPNPNTVSVPFFATPLVNKYWHSFRGPRQVKVIYSGACVFRYAHLWCSTHKPWFDAAHGFTHLHTHQTIYENNCLITKNYTRALH